MSEPGEEIHELALEAIRVLELVDHDRAEAELLALPERAVVTEQVARPQLQVLEVERRLAVLGGRVGVREAEQQLLQQLSVLQRELSSAACSTALRASSKLAPRSAAHAQAAQIEQALRQRRRFEQLKRLHCRCRAASVASASSARQRAASAQLREALFEPGRSPSSSSSSRPAERSVS